jgi:hypothetical protein
MPKISPILALCGVLTVATLTLVVISQFNVSTLQLLAILAWLGMAFVHGIGWLVIVLEYKPIVLIVQRLGLRWVFNVSWFLPFYAVVTLLVAGSILVSMS